MVAPKQDVYACRVFFGKLLEQHDAEVASLLYLSNEEVQEECKKYAELDREAIQQWKRFPEARLVHRRFVNSTKVDIKNTHLWLQAVTHPSFKVGVGQIADGEFVTTDPHYERIEFLGDAVLQMMSSAFLVDAFPYHQEHLLTHVRSSLVKNKRLAVVAKKLGYEEFIRLGKDAKKEESTLFMGDVLADVYEATLGALFLENVSILSKLVKKESLLTYSGVVGCVLGQCGFDQVQAVLQQSLFPLLTEVRNGYSCMDEEICADDTLSSLPYQAIKRREWMAPKQCLSHHLALWNRNSNQTGSCHFKTLPKPGASHEPRHSVALLVDNHLICRTTARTIAEAKELACKRALKLYGLTLHND